MKAGLARATAYGLSLMLLSTAAYLPAASGQSVWAQVAARSTTGAPVQLAQQSNPAPTYAAQQLDQLLAPIALYPDPLLAQILMAATYPLEIVEAARWVQDPNNARLRGDQLDAALQPQDWDPSVKSLVPFPQILQMMNSKLDWTQALGNAFLAQQADVMDSVQRLRAQAQAAGTLQSGPQETVSTQGQTIVIEPASPELVYVPYYDPRLVYGAWGYPDYPPIYFPPPPNYAYVAGPRIFFGVGFGIIGVLWGWDRWDWGRHDIYIDPDRYNRINNYAIVHDNRPRYTANTWQHDPAHRRGVPYSDPGRSAKVPAGLGGISGCAARFSRLRQSRRRARRGQPKGDQPSRSGPAQCQSRSSANDGGAARGDRTAGSRPNSPDQRPHRDAVAPAARARCCRARHRHGRWRFSVR